MACVRSARLCKKKKRKKRKLAPKRRYNLCFSLVNQPRAPFARKKRRRRQETPPLPSFKANDHSCGRALFRAIYSFSFSSLRTDRPSRIAVRIRLYLWSLEDRRVEPLKWDYVFYHFPRSPSNLLSLSRSMSLSLSSPPCLFPEVAKSCEPFPVASGDAS